MKTRSEKIIDRFGGVENDGLWGKMEIAKTILEEGTGGGLWWTHETGHFFRDS